MIPGMTIDIFPRKPGRINIPKGVPIIVCNGRGVDSTAMLVALHQAGIRPDVITFADLKSEKPETYEHGVIVDKWLESIGFPVTDVCSKQTLDSTPYSDLEGNCIDNETLPSLAFGMKSCSIKWKQGPQDYFIMGCQSGPNKCDPHPIWVEAQRRGIKPIKLIGYDAGPADLRRSKKLKTSDANFQYIYPLQQLGWKRQDCIDAIISEGLPVPVKSACFFCPASKQWELYWLAAKHPDYFLRALKIERIALTGRHSRYDDVEFGASWEDMVKGADSFPSSDTTIGLGRSMAWGQWAVVNGVVDKDGNFIGDPEVLMERAMALNDAANNAVDGRTC